MSKINDGGPAFPLPVAYNAIEERVVTRPNYGEDGMSLRVWLAAKCQPGTVEAYQLAGEPEVSIPHGYDHERFKRDREYRASAWWKTLSLEEKYQFYAQLRFRVADAMIAQQFVPIPSVDTDALAALKSLRAIIAGTLSRAKQEIYAEEIAAADAVIAKANP